MRDVGGPHAGPRRASGVFLSLATKRDKRALSDDGRTTAGAYHGASKARCQGNRPSSPLLSANGSLFLLFPPGSPASVFIVTGVASYGNGTLMSAPRYEVSSSVGWQRAMGSGLLQVP